MSNKLTHIKLQIHIYIYIYTLYSQTVVSQKKNAVVIIIQFI